MHTRLRSASELFQMDPLKETSGRTTRKCTSTWWNTIRLESRMLSLASNQGNCSAIQSYHQIFACQSSKNIAVWACLRAYLCVRALLRLRMNGLPLWEQRELFLALPFLRALLMVVCFRSILMRKHIWGCTKVIHLPVHRSTFESS